MRNPFLAKTPAEILNLRTLLLGVSVDRAIGSQYSEARVNRRLYDGDHWLDGEGWIGPIPATDNVLYTDLTAEIRRIFCSRNIIREVIDRKVDGLLRRMPRIGYTMRENQEEPTEDQLLLLKEAKDYFLYWAKKRHLMAVLKEVYGRTQLGENPVVRIFVPPGLLTTRKDGATLIELGSMYDSLDKIHVQVLYNNTAVEITDPETLFTAMACTISTGMTTYMEASFVDGDTTYIKTSDTSNGTEALTALKLGRVPTMMRPKVKACISQSVREQQFSANLAQTMMNRNTVTAGFLERIITDAMPPGKWVSDPDNPTGEEIYEIAPYKLGGGTTNFLMAAEYRDPDTGERRFGNPQVHYHSPEDPHAFIAAAQAAYTIILQEVGQPHLIIAGKATTSGVSREQAQEIFRGTLNDDKTELDALLEWLMTVVLNMAANFSGILDRYADIIPDTEVNIATAPMSGIERQDTREDVRAGLLSVETAMTYNDVQDPQAELRRIRDEQNDILLMLSKKVDMFAVLVKAGLSPEQAGTFLDFSEEQLSQMIEMLPKTADTKSVMGQQDSTMMSDGNGANGEAPATPVE